MAEKQIPGDVFYDAEHNAFVTAEGVALADAEFDKQWDHRSDEFPAYKHRSNFVLIEDMGADPVELPFATLSITPANLIAHIDPANADFFEPVKRTVDIWVVRLKGEQTTVGEMKCTFDNGVETTAAFLVSSGAEIDPNTYTKLWKFNIARVNEELASAATRDNSDSTELRQAKNTIAALDGIVKQLERKVNPAKDSQITSLSYQLTSARTTIAAQRSELKETSLQLDDATTLIETQRTELTELRKRLGYPDLPIVIKKDIVVGELGHSSSDKDTIERLSASVRELSETNAKQADRIREGTKQLTELKIELRAKANLEKRIIELTNDLLRTADERDNGVMEAVRAKLPEELRKATKELSEEKARLKEVEKETDITRNRETRKLEKKIRKLKGALRAAANDIELVEELKDANTQLTERLSELSIRAARLEAGQDFLAAVSIDEEERLSGVEEQLQYEAVGLDPIHSSYDNFPTVHIHINGGVVNFAAPIINQ